MAFRRKSGPIMVNVIAEVNPVFKNKCVASFAEQLLP